MRARQTGRPRGQQLALVGFQPGSGETQIPPPHKAGALQIPVASSSSPPLVLPRSGRTASLFFFFSLLFFFFFFSCRQNNFKISKLQIKFANQSGTHTVPKHATFHPPMHSYHVFHRRVERPSIAGIGCAPEVALKKRRVLQNVGHRRRFSESKETRTIF